MLRHRAARRFIFLFALASRHIAYISQGGQSWALAFAPHRGGAAGHMLCGISNSGFVAASAWTLWRGGKHP